MLSTSDACGGFAASGQAVTLVTDGTMFRVVATACGASSSTSVTSIASSTVSLLEYRVAQLEAVAAGGALSYDVAFSLTVESSADPSTYDVSGLKTTLASMLGVSESRM